MKLRFHKGRFTDFWYLNIIPETRAKHTIEYFYNGRPPLCWGDPDE